MAKQHVMQLCRTCPFIESKCLAMHDTPAAVSCFPVIPAAAGMLTPGNGTFANMQQLFSKNTKSGNSVCARM